MDAEKLREEHLETIKNALEEKRGTIAGATLSIILDHVQRLATLADENAELWKRVQRLEEYHDKIEGGAKAACGQGELTDAERFVSATTSAAYNPQEGIIHKTVGDDPPKPTPAAASELEDDRIRIVRNVLEKHAIYSRGDDGPLGCFKSLLEQLAEDRERLDWTLANCTVEPVRSYPGPGCTHRFIEDRSQIDEARKAKGETSADSE